MDDKEVKAQRAASVLILIKIALEEFDLEFCKEAYKEFENQALRERTLIILNPGYPIKKIELLEKKAKALMILCSYYETLQEISKLKAELDLEEENKAEISKLFT